MATSNTTEAPPTQEQEPPWHASFPTPSLTPDIFPARRALTLLTLKIASLLLVDVRRTDYTGGSIRGSLNIPAQGFYWNRGALYELAYKADMEWVVFTCGSSKEGGRAWRCAGWFLEHVRHTVGDEDMQVFVLEGGVKGWVGGGEVYRGLMDGFVEGEWGDVLEKEAQEKMVEGGDGGKVEVQAGAVQEKEGGESSTNAVGGTTEVKEKVWATEAFFDD
ncbi:hypothetical protein M409DRAFT_25452 [Zasmidium cellare ATCC 36951]|uniref:Rhodanese domain-containing protein n=1 Tax=Zasmidium cellare ATCC 36951 TaxID=1080233 RepID=A0A6A6CAQ7_ZASCE|nr:uncharacterized protein M409DRAFT_25452 [Zasmidium cellare ATCC 36951]KAF2164105.1 hypothetical protein M409DRAFT_25452 [Zasmidium cellare ATCC 36951]